jgi:hypothetical protein
MGQKPILSDELEKELLPSGLQACLLLRATHRQRRNTCVTAQYRSRQTNNNAIAITTTDTERTSSSTRTQRAVPNGSSEEDESGKEEDEKLSLMFAGYLAPSTNNNGKEAEALPTTTSNTAISTDPPPLPSRGHHRVWSVDTMLEFPQASVLNSTTSRRELQNLIETSLNDHDESTKKDLGNNNSNNKKSPTNNKKDVPSNLSGVPPTHPNHRGGGGGATAGHHRRVSSTRVFMEWAEETDVRELYGAAPPADLPDEITVGEGEEEEVENRWSPWNRSRRLSSFSMDDFIEHNTNNGDNVEEKNCLAQPLLPLTDDSLEEGDFLRGISLLSSAMEETKPKQKEDGEPGMNEQIESAS